jgi:hypothetical protein
MVSTLHHAHCWSNLRILAWARRHCLTPKSVSVQDNVALIAVLEALEAPQTEGSGSGSRRPLICIANTHIHANPELNDVKLWQVINVFWRDFDNRALS